jgi:integrase
MPMVSGYWYVNAIHMHLSFVSMSPYQSWNDSMGRPPLPIGTAGQINTYKTPSGYRAACRYRDYDGVTRFVERHGPTKGKARDRLRRALRNRGEASSSAEITGETLVADLCDLWFAEIADRGLSPNTIQAYRDRLDKQVLPAMGAMRIQEITVSRVDRLIKTTKEHHGPGTAKLVRSVVSGIFGLAARHDALDRNPVRDVARLHNDSEPARALSLEQARDLRARLSHDQTAVEDDVPHFVDMMLATGLRIGETAAITWPALDLDAGTVEVRGTLVRVTGQGLFIKPKPKSKSGYRTLELPQWAVEMLRLRRLSSKPNPWDVVFTAPMGGLRDPRNTQRDLRAALHRAGYPWVTSHSCRKTVATLMDQAGLSARAAADQLGHAKVSMTQDHYYGRRTARTGAARILEAVAV